MNQGQPMPVYKLLANAISAYFACVATSTPIQKGWLRLIRDIEYRCLPSGSGFDNRCEIVLTSGTLPGTTSENIVIDFIYCVMKEGQDVTHVPVRVRVKGSLQFDFNLEIEIGEETEPGDEDENSAGMWDQRDEDAVRERLEECLRMIVSQNDDYTVMLHNPVRDESPSFIGRIEALQEYRGKKMGLTAIDEPETKRVLGRSIDQIADLYEHIRGTITGTILEPTLRKVKHAVNIEEVITIIGTIQLESILCAITKRLGTTSVLFNNYKFIAYMIWTFVLHGDIVPDEPPPPVVTNLAEENKRRCAQLLNESGIDWDSDTLWTRRIYAKHKATLNGVLALLRENRISFTYEDIYLNNGLGYRLSLPKIVIADQEDEDESFKRCLRCGNPCACDPKEPHHCKVCCLCNCYRRDEDENE